MNSVFFYFAYGLNIASDIALPELIEAESSLFDVQVLIDRSIEVSDLVPPEVVGKSIYINLENSRGVIYVPDIALYIIEHGEKITVVPGDEYCELLIRFYLLGTVMGVLLYQRSLLVLHASAINIGGRAVAFLGASGEGKSSTAATFVTHGYPLITDDAAPINVFNKPLVISPGFPQVKIGQEIAEALGYKYSDLHSVHSFKVKKALKPVSNFSLKPVPLERIYILTSDAKFSIEPIDSAEAVTEIARHSRPTTLYHSGGSSHFFQCVNLVKNHPIYRLKRPKSLNLLPELVKCVEKDLLESKQPVTSLN